MTHQDNSIHESIIRDLSEGVLVVGFNGVIMEANLALTNILECQVEDLIGKPFFSRFFQYDENDAFNQLILDAIYDHSVSHEGFVPFFTGSQTKQLHVTSSYLKENGKAKAMIAVIDDLTELFELRDAMKAMETIKKLNKQLEIRNQLIETTFGRFLSDDIVKKLLDTPDGLKLGGRKKMVTVMMSDLRGFTAMSERMLAEELITMLNHYLAEMTEIIQHYKGTIIEFLGDGILAIFGDPIDDQYHAANGVAAAIAMQAKMKEVNLWNSEHGYPSMEMGIGMNSGEVIVGNIGSEKRTKYGVMGAHVNLCGRIESYTVGGQILVSPMTIEAISSPIEISGTMEVMPKGVNTPLMISDVTGIGEPYCISCKQEDTLPNPLEKSVSISFRPIQDKHVNDHQHVGEILALNQSEAILQTDSKIDVFDNLQIDIGGHLFAKVISQIDENWLIRFTARPKEFDAWFQNSINKK